MVSVINHGQSSAYFIHKNKILLNILEMHLISQLHFWTEKKIKIEMEKMSTDHSFIDK